MLHHDKYTQCSTVYKFLFYPTPIKLSLMIFELIIFSDDGIRLGFNQFRYIKMEDITLMSSLLCFFFSITWIACKGIKKIKPTKMRMLTENHFSMFFFSDKLALAAEKETVCFRGC